MIDGPRQPPARGGKPDSLVVFAHGYGSNGADLISLAPYWAKLLPGAQFVSPNAPEPVPGMPGAYQWFGLTSRDPSAMARGVQNVADQLNRFIDRELERYGLDGGRLALVGFSQGTMIALHVGLRRKTPPAAILGFSGALVAAERLKEEAVGRPPILLVHGERDDMIPVSSMFGAAEALAEAGLGVQWHISYGAPHTIAQDGLELGGAFLKMALSQPALAGAAR
ncbi:MAG: dienelactone hydrolase family protein [Caulobacterales bacterium]